MRSLFGFSLHFAFFQNLAPRHAITLHVSLWGQNKTEPLPLIFQLLKFRRHEGHKSRAWHALQKKMLTIRQYTESVGAHCLDCQYPKCSLCCEKPTALLAPRVTPKTRAERDAYVCKDCKYPSCLGCKRPMTRKAREVWRKEPKATWTWEGNRAACREQAQRKQQGRARSLRFGNAMMPHTASGRPPPAAAAGTPSSAEAAAAPGRRGAGRGAQ